MKLWYDKRGVVGCGIEETKRGRTQENSCRQGLIQKGESKERSPSKKLIEEALIQHQIFVTNLVRWAVEAAIMTDPNILSFGIIKSQRPILTPT